MLLLWHVTPLPLSLQITKGVLCICPDPDSFPGDRKTQLRFLTTDAGLIAVTKRAFAISTAALLFSNPFSKMCIAMAQVLDLQEYTDPVEGFTLLRPTSWAKVDKAGATVLFQDATQGSNNVGVVVVPVRISRLGEFGSPEVVAGKLMEAERRKESTKEAQVVAAGERAGKNGVQVYEFEYKVDSTRGGMKRVFTAAFVASKKLYLLNITHSDGTEKPLDSDRRLILEQILHSFDFAPMTS